MRLTAYPPHLTFNALRTLSGLRLPLLPERGQSVTVARHDFHPDQTYTVGVNLCGDIEISVETRGQFGYSYGSGYCVCRNGGEG